LLVLVVVATAALAREDAGCFPLTRDWGSGPNNTPLAQWWCGADSLYGFLGFSYPVEDTCSGYSYAGFKNDFNRQKMQYNATFVRLYLPVCRQTSFWVNMVKAARDTSMALIPMIFWDWQQNDPIMNAAENALLGVFTDPDVGSIAPYIIHSVAFGDELGEQGTYWLPDMKSFKSKLLTYGVPITITDDWDRAVYKSGSGFSSFGQQVNTLSDLTQAHVQPYYHPDEAIDAWHFWPYFLQQLQFLTTNNKPPIIISQTMWAYNKNGHQRGKYDNADTMPNYTEYWDTINNNCTTFKNMKVSWFFHTWYGEPGFDILNNTGPVFNWKPKMC